MTDGVAVETLGGAKTPEQSEKSAHTGEAERRILFVTKVCPNCRLIKPQLEQCGLQYDIVDVEEDVEMAQRYHLTSAPSLVELFPDGYQVHSGIGEIQKYILARRQ